MMKTLCLLGLLLISLSCNGCPIGEVCEGHDLRGDALQDAPPPADAATPAAAPAAGETTAAKAEEHTAAPKPDGGHPMDVPTTESSESLASAIASPLAALFISLTLWMMQLS